MGIVFTRVRSLRHQGWPCAGLPQANTSALTSFVFCAGSLRLVSSGFYSREIREPWMKGSRLSAQGAGTSVVLSTRWTLSPWDVLVSSFVKWPQWNHNTLPQAQGMLQKKAHRRPQESEVTGDCCSNSAFWT